MTINIKGYSIKKYAGGEDTPLKKSGGGGGGGVGVR